MYETRYVRATSPQEAVSALQSSDDGKFLAGGMTLLPTMKQRLAAPDCVIDLSKCGLSGIEDTGDAMRIGAMTTHAEVARSQNIPAVAMLAEHIGDRQVRNKGTIGGSVANNDPSACYPAAVLALGGTIHTTSRDIAADEFFTGMFETDLDEDELITAITLPKPDRAAYAKAPSPASRYAMAGVFVATFGNEVRVAVTGAGEDGVYRCDLCEAALGRNFDASALEAVTISADGLMGDIHASAEFRARLVLAMAKQAVNSCQA
ncbi:MAG: FAD binding domain-containing protein [Candidatus Puniceispirillaceae bacterium]|jgi:aerobic carbon-monoxide dehydrogenase medium subunit